MELDPGDVGRCGLTYKTTVELRGEHADWNRAPWPGATITICMSCFMTGGPGKDMELVSHHQPEETPRV